MSWSGTVTCSKCYESGHNRRSCPQLKKAWQDDPEGYEAREYLRHEASKKAPKTCSYCKTTGHTRAGCTEMKRHKLAYHRDALLFRKAIAKWMRETGLAVGALVHAYDVQYYAEGSYRYPNDEGYIAPVGLVMNSIPNADHYSAISGSSEWSMAGSLITMEPLGSANVDEFRRKIGLNLPCIPGIIPLMGIDWYNSTINRMDRCQNVNWKVVSPGYQHFDSTEWTSSEVIDALTREHFKREQEQTTGEFRTFTDERRVQFRNYINGSIDLSEMKDAELPNNDT